MLLNPLKFHAPPSLNEAARLYSTLGDARLLAGGTFIINNLKTLKNKGVKTPQNLISLKRIPELAGISADKEKLTIGSMTTIAEVLQCPDLTDNFAVLKSACRNLATNPIRNMATVGGNLTCRYAWPELGAVFMALDASLRFVDSDGKEETIALEEFFKKEAKTTKVLQSVSVKREKEAHSSYQRVKKLSPVDVPLLAVCIKTNRSGNRLTDTRVVINNGVKFAQRDLELENFLNETEINSNTAVKALDYLDNPIYDERSDDYKKTMFYVCIKNAIRELIESRKK